MAQVTRVMISVGSRPSVNEHPPKGRCLGRFSGVEEKSGVKGKRNTNCLENIGIPYHFYKATGKIAGVLGVSSFSGN